MNTILNQENFLNHIEKINENIVFYEKNDVLFSFFNAFLNIYTLFIIAFIIINIYFLRILKNKLINYVKQENKNNMFYNYLLFINKADIIVLLLVVIISTFITEEGYKQIYSNVEKENIIEKQLNENIVYDVLVEYDIDEIKRTNNSYIIHYEEDGVFKKIDVSANNIIITIGDKNKVNIFDSVNILNLLKDKKLDKLLENKIIKLVTLEQLSWLEETPKIKTFKSIKKIELTEETYFSLLNNQHKEKVGEMNE